MRSFLLAVILSSSAFALEKNTGEVSPQSSSPNSKCAQAQLIHCDNCVKTNCPGLVDSDLVGDRTPSTNKKGKKGESSGSQY